MEAVAFYVGGAIPFLTSGRVVCASLNTCGSTWITLSEKQTYGLSQSTESVLSRIPSSDVFEELSCVFPR